MTGSDDLRDAMASFLSPDQVEPLLGGASAPGALDAGASRVGRLLAAMHSPAGLTASRNERQEHQEHREHQAVAAIVEAIREAPQPLAAHRRSRVLTKRMSAKAAVIAATLTALLAGGTAAAAATGSLPAPAQSAASSALAHVGLSVPSPNAHANPHATDKSHRGPKAHGGAKDGDGGADPKSGAKGPDATGNAKYGLCHAWAANPTPNAHSHKRDSVAFTNLQAAAETAGTSVAGYCKGVTPPAGDDEATTTPSDETTKTGHSKPSHVGREPREAKPKNDEPSTGGDHRTGAGADRTSHAPNAPIEGS
jgi:hypothetical protein